MKKIFFSLMLLIAFPFASLCQTDNSGVKWTGKYHFESEDWIDVIKPVIGLSYKNNVLYTAEPQHDEHVSKKFKKIN